MEHLARAWVFATEDPVTGIGQIAARSKSTMFEKFTSFAMPDATEKTYGGRTLKSVRAKFEDMSADVQTFHDAFCKVTPSSPTCNTETKVLSIGIAIHMGKPPEMSYKAKRCPYSSWRSHLAFTFKVLRKLPKYSDEAMVHSMEHQVAQIYGEEDGNVDPEDLTPIQIFSLTKATALDGATTTHGLAFGVQDKVERSQRLLRKNSSLRLRAEDDIRRKALENAKKISTSLKWRNELSEKKKSLMAYHR